MNKEEIEKAKQCLNEIIQNTYAEGKAKKLDILRRYIKELEQKESILDKVTDYVKMYIDDKQNEYEAIYESYICQTDEDEYIKEKELAVIKWQKQVLKNVLNIIEGEKKETEQY